MKKVLYLHLPLLLLASGAALADDAAVLKCRTLSDTAQRLACYDAMPIGAAQPVAARSAEQNFGMPRTEKAPEPEQIESTIVGDFDGWSGNTKFTLANGQVWRINDGSEAVLPRQHNPAIRIKRGLLGAAMYFQVVGHNSTARVRRLQ